MKEENTDAKKEISDDIYEVEESSEEENVPTHQEYDDSQENWFALDEHAESEMADEYKAKDDIMNEYDGEYKEAVGEGNVIESTETVDNKVLVIQDLQNDGSFKDEETLVQLSNDYYPNFYASYDLERSSEGDFSEKSFQDYYLQEFKEDAVEEPVFSRPESEAAHMALKSGNNVAVGAQVSDMIYTVSSARSISVNMSSLLIAFVVLLKAYFNQNLISDII